ncbi:hypothetical protein PT2222_80314 [Paraburkholderia tropica]
MGGLARVGKYFAVIGRIRAERAPGRERNACRRRRAARHGRGAQTRYATSGLARLQFLIARAEELDQPVHAALLDLLVELRAIGLDQPRAQHIQIVEPPALRRLVEPVIDLDGLAARLRERAHDHVGVARRIAHRLILDLLVGLELRERARVQVNQQELELVHHLLLLRGRGGAPVRPHREPRGAAEIDVRQDVAIDDVANARDIARGDRLRADFVEHLLGRRLDERLRVRLVDALRGARGRGEAAEPAGKQRDKQKELLHSISRPSRSWEAGRCATLPGGARRPNRALATRWRRVGRWRPV